MSASHPKAFISHSTKDIAFVERLSSDLRANGVDAWYAPWEIKPGDSIRAKLDHGLAECEIFIIVLSKASIHRPWVQAELDAATVRKLDGKVKKIIPIKIDSCDELPPTLGSLLWEDFSKQPYEVALKRVLNSIFSVETKPALGSIPDLPPLVAPRRTKISTTTAIFWTAMALAVVLVASRLTVNIGMPPWIGQLAAGGVLAGIVWKFFERVEAVLTDNTKLEIAVWLLDQRTLSARFQNWPMTFANVFDRVFGKKHLTLKCFWRSSVASVFNVAVCLLWAFLFRPAEFGLFRMSVGRLFPLMLVCLFVCNVIPDYASLLGTRGSLGIMKSDRHPSAILGLLALNFVVTLFIASWTTVWAQGAVLAIARPTDSTDLEQALLNINLAVAGGALVLLSSRLWFYPAFFTSIWLWLYAGSGFLLKAARRFDTGFDWFNRHFDIEKRPLQSIGLVAGALVAVVYWAAVIVGRIVG